MKPLELRVNLRGSLKATIAAAGKAIRDHGEREITCAYGPEIAYGKDGEKVALIYRVDERGQDTEAVFQKKARQVVV